MINDENSSLKPEADSHANLLQKVGGLPTKPGIYIYKNDSGSIIYVGKAKNLRNRVRSYFQDRPMDAKTKALIRYIHDVEIIVTDTETEALLLENNLIKQHRPKYNILLKDDKTYPSIRITNEEFPRIFSTRTIIRDGSTYFGPYTDGKYLYHLLRTLRSIFPLRSCDLPLSQHSITAGKYKVCLDYHIKKCNGPCVGYESKEEYSMHIKQAIQILNGKTRDVERMMEERMSELADAMRFEEAAAIRNRLHHLREYVAKQKVVSSDLIDRDIFAISVIDDDACIVILNIRDGKMVGKRHFFIAQASGRDISELLRVALERYYLESESYPTEILLPFEIEDAEYDLSWLKEKKGSAIEIVVPKIGDKKKVISMAETNATFIVRELHLQRASRDQALPRGVAILQQDLRLEKAPRRIECFDNSHIQGTDYVSSMVVFSDGKPKKSDYRKFKLGSFEGNDDFAAMKEVIRRRYDKAPEDLMTLPDLIVIDGGKGQLSAAMEVISGLEHMQSIPVIGLAKRLEEIVLAGQSDTLLLPRTSTGLRLLQAIRDEAHRFAITYHRSLRDKRTLSTELTEIQGIGEKTATKLLKEFGSVKHVKEASQEAIIACIGKAQAQKVMQALGMSDD
ncbi:MAG: excinuclease ABC subunit UvrC [Candidatus Kapaibacteriota bacterium]